MCSTNMYISITVNIMKKSRWDFNKLCFILLPQIMLIMFLFGVTSEIGIVLKILLRSFTAVMEY